MTKAIHTSIVRFKLFKKLVKEANKYFEELLNK